MKQAVTTYPYTTFSVGSGPQAIISIVDQIRVARYRYVTIVIARQNPDKLNSKVNLMLEIVRTIYIYMNEGQKSVFPNFPIHTQYQSIIYKCKNIK